MGGIVRMNRTEHLLTILAEECCEVAQRATKALRFGLDEVQPDQTESNAERMLAEYCDLIAMMEMLEMEGLLSRFGPGKTAILIRDKKAKVEKFIAYSARLGVLT
jgi:hypothetical protein